MRACCHRVDRLVVALLLGAATVVLCQRMVSAADFYQMNRTSLADFQFEGVPLGATAEEFKLRFPSARFAYEKTDAEVGVTVYTVAEAKTADGGCFYFFHDRLYQIDLQYHKSRIEALGGASVIMDNLMASMGPPDYADFFRRTWYQPACRCRADFWVQDDTGMLVVTDVSRSQPSDRRLHTAAAATRLELGFGRDDRQSASK